MLVPALVLELVFYFREQIDALYQPLTGLIASSYQTFTAQSHIIGSKTIPRGTTTEMQDISGIPGREIPVMIL